MESEQKGAPYLKGTTTVAMICKDGVILAADKRATSGHLIANKDVDKTYMISDDIVLTMAGTVSDAQLLSKLIRSEIKLREIRTRRKTTVKEAANLLAGMVYGNVRTPTMIPGITHFIIGGKDSNGFSIYDIYPDGSITEVDGYISSGSGSVFAYGLLENAYNKNLTTKEGAELAVKSINTALQRDSASGNGVRVVRINEDGVKTIINRNVITDLSTSKDV